MIKEDIKKLVVIGAGYVGLISAVCFAKRHHVICVDVDKDKIRQLQHGHTTIYEESLADYLRDGQKSGRLEFTTQLTQHLPHSDAIFICVGTPFNDETNSKDLSFVLAVSQTLANNLTHDCLVVTKSTVPVGTNKKIEKIISTGLSKRKKSSRVYVVSNPEFLREGTSISDFMNPDRIVIGARNHEAFAQCAHLYDFLKLSDGKILFMNLESAELSKYAANAMLATKISFINEIAAIAERTGADVQDIETAISMDERIGAHFISAGIGYGGSCFPKDVKGLQSFCDKEFNYKARLLEAVDIINEQQKEIIADKILAHFNGHITGKRFAFWGGAFKEQTDDIRKSPALFLIDTLLENGAFVTLHDAIAYENLARYFAGRDSVTIIHDSPYDAITDADALVVTLNMPAYREADMKRVQNQLSHPVLVDCRNIYDGTQLHQQGWTCIQHGICHV